MTKTAPTTKIANGIDNGFWVDLHTGVTLYAREDDIYETTDIDRVTGETVYGVEGGGYSITSHKGEMPAFHYDSFDTIEDLANAMRNCADLRTWRLIDHS